MCGIYGYISHKNPFLPEEKVDKLRMLSHRGPDNTGFYHKDNLFLGHMRLSILDLSDAANQPFQDSQCCLIYNGEIYNYLQLREKHLGGKHWLTSSDTEVLFELLRLQGIGCLPLLNGMFALAFYDKSKNELLLARDTVGIKPLYYIAEPDFFEFSSEIKSLSFVPDLDALKDVLVYGHFEEGCLPYKNVKELMPGHVLQLELGTGKYRIEPFVRLEDKVNDARFKEFSQAGNLASQLDSLLQSSILLHLQSDAPIGALCSGGIDSSLISALAVKHRKDVRLYHAGVAGERGEEGYARMVSDHLNVPLESIRMTKEEYWNAFPVVTYHNDLPIYHPNDISLYSICRKAQSDGMKVLLSGEGADELFGGYAWHQYFASVLKRYDRRVMSRGFLGGVISRAIERISQSGGFPDLDKDDFIHCSALGIGYSSGEIGSLARSSSLAAQQFKAWKRWMENLEVYEGLAGKNEAAVLSFLLNNLYGHLSSILHRTDRILMMNSLEGRVPFLENSIFEFALNLPLRQKISGKEGKVILKKVASRYLPHEVVYRRKAGFPVPWYEYLPSVPHILNDGFVCGWTGLSAMNLQSWYRSDPLLKFRLISIEVWGRIFVWDQDPEDVKVM